MIGDRLFQAVSSAVENELQRVVNRLDSRNQNKEVDHQITKDSDIGLNIQTDTKIENLKKYLSELVYAEHYKIYDIGNGVGVFTKTIPSNYVNIIRTNCKELFTFFTVKNGCVIPEPKLEIHSECNYINDILAPTAYYTPTDSTITLFTAGRHIKDILRSYCHELIHHMQNCEGRIGAVNTTDTNTDSDLVELEGEAYLKGNMIFRNWTDSKKAL